jgi:hypothetical protein
MSDSKKHALTVLANAQMSTSGGHLDRMKKVVVEQLALVTKLENEAALRGLLCGLALHRVKASLKHGEWVPWQTSCLKAGRSQVNNYMRLATVFVAKARLSQPELLALDCNEGGLVEAGDNAMTRRLFAAAEKFVGSCSLNELLIKYGIKGVTRDTDSADDTPTGGTAGEQMLFQEIAEHMQGLRLTLLKPEHLMRLQPAQLDAINVEMESSVARWRKLYREAKGVVH